MRHRLAGADVPSSDLLKSCPGTIPRARCGSTGDTPQKKREWPRPRHAPLIIADAR